MIRVALAIWTLVLGGMVTAGVAEAADKTWRLGRVYYRMVCTDCHEAMAGVKISPNSMTKAEWTAYLDADAHDKSGKSNAKVSYFTSTEFREGAKDTNKAAKKLLGTPESELQEAVRAWVIYGAKDSDHPSSCQ